MSISFAPKLQTADTIVRSLRRLQTWLLIMLAAVLPWVVVTPGVFLLTPTKMVVAVGIAALALVIGSVLMLRQGYLTCSLHIPIVAWWGVVFGAAVSALFSEDIVFSLFGIVLESNTVGFLFLLGIIMSLGTVFGEKKTELMYLVTAFFGSISLLALYHLLRLFFGPSFLSFGGLNTTTSSILGGWNDVAIVMAIGLLVLMISIVQLTLPRVVEWLVFVVAAAFLLMLGVINFTVLWYGLALLSMSLLLFVLTKDHGGEATSRMSITGVALIGMVALVATLFVIAGSTIGGYLSTVTGTAYIEVRPSLLSTAEMMNHSLRDNFLFGVGPNQFETLWRTHKSNDIVQTIFWNLNFNAGNGYITTWVATTGILGMITWVAFLLGFLYVGIRTLLFGQGGDVFWYYIASVSFAVSCLVWGMSLIYVPGITILIWGALMTGVLVVSAKALGVNPCYTKRLSITRRTNFIFIGGVMVTIVGIMYGVVALSERYAANLAYASITTLPADENQITRAIEALVRANTLHQSDVYLREIVSLQLLQLSTMVAKESPTEAEQQEFNSVVSSAVQNSTALTERYPRNPANWLIRGDVLAFLAIIRVDGAYDRSLEMYREALRRDPKNPLYFLREAQLALGQESTSEAIEALRQALQIKPNYVEAIALLSQVQISTGETEAAITSTRSLITLEPRNPALYYQLGVLFIAQEAYDRAAGAFSDAIALLPDFANARYLRALVIAEQGNRARAISELEGVKALSPDNQVVDEVIARLRDEATQFSIAELLGTINEPQRVIDSQGAAVVTEGADTPGLTPVNTPPRVNQGQVSAQENERDAEASTPPQNLEEIEE